VLALVYHKKRKMSMCVRGVASSIYTSFTYIFAYLARVLLK
jgi:hypothetical protein